ncbi:hypothetical protein [Vibrio paucivorans]|uniref:Uncharacterized protein n=1 Tax=Vibrio paucivorans TaxID=2829489 RepID=A0A9X3HR48_9VIBR|nr:hypothetical protein [Vibrio paucivorans]MCW8333656.1 hypothetical protein [Vibrio paucivorans]
MTTTSSASSAFEYEVGGVEQALISTTQSSTKQRKNIIDTVSLESDKSVVPMIPIKQQGVSLSNACH